MIVFFSNVSCRRLASASKDASVRIWDVPTQKVEFTLNGHTQSVSSVKWGGAGLIYTASHDRTIKVWRGTDVSSKAFMLHNFTYI